VLNVELKRWTEGSISKTRLQSIGWLCYQKMSLN